MDFQPLARVDGPAVLDGEIEDLEAAFVFAQQCRGLAFQTGACAVKWVTVYAGLLLQAYSPCFIFSMAPAPS